MHKVKTIMIITLMIVSTFTLATITSNGDQTPELYLSSNAAYNITANEYFQMRGDIWGDRIVWEDYRNDPTGVWGVPEYRNSDIYMYDLSTGETIRLTDHTSAQIKPSIWENYVVWEDYRHGNADIYYMDLNTMTEHRVTSHASDQISPRINNGRIVWLDYRGPDHMFGDIYMYDIQEEETLVISDGRFRKASPDIYGDIVVWTDYRNYWAGIYDTMKADIYMYDLTTGEESPLVEEDIHQRNPSIYMDTVTWIEYDGEKNNIYMKQIGENKTLVSAEPSNEESPRIYGNRIVYNERYYEGGTQVHGAIWLYNILEGTKTRLAKVDVGEVQGVVARFPAIYQDRVIWEERHLSSSENLTYQYDIYYRELGKEAPDILSVSVYSDTHDGNHRTEMILREGAYFTVTAEVIDVDGDLDEVLLEYNGQELNMEHVGTDLFSVTVIYDENMTAETVDLTVKAMDQEGFTATNEVLSVTFIENPPEITYVGVGTSPTDLSLETNYTIDPGNTLYFAADVIDPDHDLMAVYLILEGFNLTEDTFRMDETEQGRFEFQLEYVDTMTEGEKTAYVVAEDMRGNTDESEELRIFAAIPDDDDVDNDDENGSIGDDDIFDWLFMLLLFVLISVIIAIIFVYRKRKDEEEEVTEEETPLVPEVQEGVCPSCVEIIPAHSQECPHCGEVLETDT